MDLSPFYIKNFPSTAAGQICDLPCRFFALFCDGKKFSTNGAKMYRETTGPEKNGPFFKMLPKKGLKEQVQNCNRTNVLLQKMVDFSRNIWDIRRKKRE
ncbi:hypothetical protein [uncultured Intestinimonas sp.]|uniref:hypothetical protein n=1 Tax=uncultured Intestinimonas sp. TaxID=1689265 RepID=UPI0025D8DE6F|nr:hypothetical protein [uncultured Intestinimonas sp.]